MLLAEPNRTNYDLHFSLLGVPVRVSPWFWLAAVLLGAGGAVGEHAALMLLIWVVVVFISIVVHEMGHALAIRYYGWRPWIVLYHFGGLASYHPDSTARFGRRNGFSTGAQIFIAFAGPLAGFIFALLVVLLLVALNRRFNFYLLGFEIPLGGSKPLLSMEDGFDTANIAKWVAVHDLLYVNIYWGLINLLPVWPLDGGRISRELFRANSAHMGESRAWILSLCVAGGVALWSALSDRFFLAVMFAMLAFSSWQMLQQSRGGPWGGYGGRGW